MQDAMLTDVGVALLDRIQEAFAAKSQGGTDEAGESWKPLSPRTIAGRIYKRAGRTRTGSARAAHPSQALTPKQRERWWQVYRQYLGRFRRGARGVQGGLIVATPADKSAAAKVAWTVLKREGAHTLLDKYGKDKVDILRDTGELMESLTPNSGSNRSVFRVLPGQVEVGTSRPYALAHHLGVPRKNLPKRALWPAPQKWPSSWWYDILAEIQAGIVELILQVVREVEE